MASSELDVTVEDIDLRGKPWRRRAPIAPGLQHLAQLQPHLPRLPRRTPATAMAAHALVAHPDGLATDQRRTAEQPLDIGVIDRGIHSRLRLHLTAPRLTEDV